MALKKTSDLAKRFHRDKRSIREWSKKLWPDRKGITVDGEDCFYPSEVEALSDMNAKAKRRTKTKNSSLYDSGCNIKHDEKDQKENPLDNKKEQPDLFDHSIVKVEISDDFRALAEIMDVSPSNYLKKLMAFEVAEAKKRLRSCAKDK